MSWDSHLVKLGVHAVRGILRTVGGRVPKQRYKGLVTAVVAGVLAEHPDLDPAEARRRAQKATGNRPARDVCGAESRSASPASCAQPGKKTPAARKTTARRTTHRLVARKPAARKKAARKVTKR